MTKQWNDYIINIGNEETTNVVLPVRLCKKHIYNGQITDVFFIFYLLKIITSIIKANTIIVSAIKPNKRKYIIDNKLASTIVPPPLSSIYYIK